MDFGIPMLWESRDIEVTQDVYQHAVATTVEAVNDRKEPCANTMRTRVHIMLEYLVLSLTMYVGTEKDSQHKDD